MRSMITSVIKWILTMFLLLLPIALVTATVIKSMK